MQKKYVKDYQKGPEGYEYTGEWFPLNRSRKELAGLATRQLLFTLCASVLFLAGLTLENVGNRRFYLLFPYLFQFLPIAYQWRGGYTLYQVTRARETVSLKRAEFDHGVKVPYTGSIWLMILSGYVVIADVITLLVLHPEENWTAEVLFLLCTVGLFLFGLILWRENPRKNVLSKNKIKNP